MATIAELTGFAPAPETLSLVRTIGKCNQCGEKVIADWGTEWFSSPEAMENDRRSSLTCGEGSKCHDVEEAQWRTAFDMLAMQEGEA